ncbi:hypothetical protein V6N13_139672 [Hibiscus sabdariffa]
MRRSNKQQDPEQEIKYGRVMQKQKPGNTKRATTQNFMIQSFVQPNDKDSSSKNSNSKPTYIFVIGDTNKPDVVNPALRSNVAYGLLNVNAHLHLGTIAIERLAAVPQMRNFDLTIKKQHEKREGEENRRLISSCV